MGGNRVSAGLAVGLLSPSLTVSREHHPELVEKVQRVVRQGHIDPEDFNGVRIPWLTKLS
jgi:hypothetical protein